MIKHCRFSSKVLTLYRQRDIVYIVPYQIGYGVNAIGKFKIIIPKGGKLKEFTDEFSFSITKDFKKCKLDKEKLRDLILEDATIKIRI